MAELMLLRFLRFAAPGMMPWSLSWDAMFLPMVELTWSCCWVWRLVKFVMFVMLCMFEAAVSPIMIGPARPCLYSLLRLVPAYISFSV